MKSGKLFSCAVKAALLVAAALACAWGVASVVVGRMIVLTVADVRNAFDNPLIPGTIAGAVVAYALVFAVLVRASLRKAAARGFLAHGHDEPAAAPATGT